MTWSGSWSASRRWWRKADSSPSATTMSRRMSPWSKFRFYLQKKREIFGIPQREEKQRDFFDEVG